MIAETQAWIKQRQEHLGHSQIPNLQIGIFVDRVHIQGWHGMKFMIGTGASLEEAWCNLQKQLPTSESSILRELAADMIARAEKMEAK
jgi:hypothetical protein